MTVWHGDLLDNFSTSLLSQRPLEVRLQYGRAGHSRRLRDVTRTGPSAIKQANVGESVPSM